jgi:hypothetical protein
MQMVKKISHPYPHVGTTLSPHVDAAHPYLLSFSLSLSISLRLSLAGPHGRGSQKPAWSTKLTWPSTTSRRARSPSSARWPFLHHHGERHMRSSSSTKVAICFFTAGVSSHLRQAGPSPPSARVSPSGPPSSAASSCSSKLTLLERCPLSLPPLISVLVHCARCRVPWHADGGALLELTEDV